MNYNLSKKVSLLHKNQKDFFDSQITLTNSFRIRKLKELKKEIKIRETEIHNALFKDMQKPTFEAMTSETV